MARFTEDDQGKTVVNSVGDEVGIVEVVEDGTAYVNPHPDWSDRIETRIGWKDEPDISEQPLDDEMVEEVTDERVILRQDHQVDRRETR